MRFIFLITIALSLLAAAVVGKRRVCEPGSVIRIACNTCRCNNQGTNMACTRKYCREQPEIKRFCKPGSHFKMDCNDCRCNEDGTNSICTLKACLS